MTKYTRAIVSLFVALLGQASGQSSANFSFGGPDPLETIQNQFIFANGGVTAIATAWSLNRSTPAGNFQQSQVVQWSPGIGVKNSSETITDTPYVPYYVDNQDHYDFILFVFDKKIDIASVRVNPSAGTFDLDASYWMGNVNPGTGLSGQSFASLASLGFGSRVDNDSSPSNSSRTLSINTPDGGVNAILFGARVGGDSAYDRFKISSISATTVPEPASAGLLVMSAAICLRRSRRR